jgi:hypothetical protein
MSNTALKNKIYKSIEEMDPVHLQSAYQILREIITQQKYAQITVEKDFIDGKIEEGLKQVDNGEGSDFGVFLKEMNIKYGGKK